MVTDLERLKERLAVSAQLVEEAESAYDATLAEQKDLQRRKAQAKEKLDEARMAQRGDVFDALRAGFSPRSLARDYGLSPATVHKYGQPVQEKKPTTRRRT